LIAEGLKMLVDLIGRGDAPVSMDNVGLAGRSYALGGEVYDLPPPLYRREVGSVDDVIACAKEAWEHWQELETPIRNGPPVIWVWPTGVVLLPDGKDSRETVHFSLTYSRAWGCLKEFALMPKLLEQKAFVRELVHTFECDPAIIAPWRKLDFNRSVLTQGEVAHGRDRLGREINAQASGIGDLPETITVDVPIFEQLGQRDRYAVTTKVEIDASACRIGIIPRATELATMEEGHLAGIIAECRKELPELGVFFGRVVA
jgi:hypothetical protein